MKTTMLIDDGVMRRLKAEAARRGTTVSSLVDAALRTMLERPPDVGGRLPALPEFDLGGARVDIADRDALYHAMEGR
jgi:hypothetical protein